MIKKIKNIFNLTKIISKNSFQNPYLIDKKTNKPKKLEVQDINQNITVYILYNEISYK